MKRTLQQWLCVLCVALIPCAGAYAQLVINEFMASNGTIISDEQGDFDDWIEIYNAGGTAVDLAGYFISDDPNEPTLWQIGGGQPGATTVPAGGHLLLWADKDDGDGANHVGIKLSSGGESILLVAPDGVTQLDRYDFGVQFEDVSFGRTADGGSSWDFFGQPTPGQPNITPAGAPQAGAPVISLQGGFKSGPVTVEISSQTDDAEIRYTTDGSVPKATSALYTGPLNFSQNTPLRARAFLAPLLASVPVTETYLFGTPHSVPVVAYTADPFEMFDPATGMYPNFKEDIEINVNAELYEVDGVQGFNQRFESEIQGTGSAKLPQKSLVLKAKSSLGSATIDYPVFGERGLDQYRSLVLRNSGSDNNITQFRDVLSSSLVLDVSDVNAAQTTITPPEILGQNYRPSVTYVNGKYWGILNIRERIDKRYIKNRFGLEDDEVDLLENSDEVKLGSIDEWNILHDYVKSNNLSSEENYEFVKDRVDVDQYADYIAFNIYIDNSDWPGNNLRRFRERKDNARWRYLTYDLDFSFGLYVAGRPYDSGDNDANSLERLKEANSFLWPNPASSTELFRSLIENDGWRTQFINRMADQLNVLYTDERVLGRINGFEAEYAPEIRGHEARWRPFWAWQNKVETLRKFARGRTDIVRGHFVGGFSDITGLADITVEIDNTDGGQVKLSTISVHAGNAPFTGTYFQGVDVPVRARPNRGYVLQNWTGALSGNIPTTALALRGPATIGAVFSKGSSSTVGIVINEINYNSSDEVDSGDWVELYNPTGAAVDISGWYFEDESGDYFGAPAGTVLAANAYLVLAENLAEFSAVYPNVSAVIGDFGRDPGGFGLSGGGELITLRNADGTLIDVVEYDDKNPWPTAADGDGPTLQLLGATLDNALAQNWKAASATPGRSNSANQLQPQTITFAALSNQPANAGPITLQATASSGLPVTFTLVSGPATIVGNVLTLAGTAGTVTVRASQSGNATFQAAATVRRTFTVNGSGPTKQAQTITFASLTNRTISARPIALSATASSGLPVGYTLISGPASLAGNVLTLNGALGTVTVRATQFGNSSFAEAQSVTRSFQVTAAPVITGYCEAEATAPWQEWIARVKLGSIDVTSRKDGYANRTDISTNLSRGVATAITLSAGYSWASHDEQFAVWIDYNGDGSFASPGELAFSGLVSGVPNGTKLGSISGSITVPSGAKQGRTRMRVVMQRNTSPSACGTFVLGEVEDYSVVIGGTVTGPDTPTPVLTRTSCPSDITRSLSAGQATTVVSWSAPTATTTCTGGAVTVSQTSGPTSGAALAAGTYAVNYTITDNCGNSASCTFTVRVAAAPPQQIGYCDSKSDFPWHEWISRVQVGTYVNASGKSPYSNFSGSSVQLVPGVTYPVELTVAYSYLTSDAYFGIWIDYNGNGGFDGNSELVFAGNPTTPPNGTASATVSGSFTLPASAQPGQTRMRVIMQPGSAPQVCGNIAFGEIEDYGVVISASAQAFQLPLILNTAEASRNAAAEVTVFPNPSFDEATVVVGSGAEVGRIAVYDATGRQVTSLPGVEQQETYLLNVRELESGLYMMRVDFIGGQHQTKRLMVSH